MEIKINISGFVRKLFPYFLRGEKTLAFIAAAVKPIQDINDNLFTLKEEIEFTTAYNSQVIYLEQFLNTIYPNGLTYPNNIHILDGANVVFDYLFNFSEAQDRTIIYNDAEAGTPKYLNNNTEQTTGVFSFVVMVPTSVQSGVDRDGNPFNETVLRSQINYYNIAGKTFDIQYF